MKLRKIYDPLFVNDFLQKYGYVKKGMDIDFDPKLYPTEDTYDMKDFYSRIPDRSFQFDEIRPMFNKEKYKESLNYLKLSNISFPEFEAICDLMYSKENYTMTKEEYTNLLKTFNEIYYTFNKYVILAIQYLNTDTLCANISDFKLYRENVDVLELPTLANIDKQIRTISESGLSTSYTELLKSMMNGDVEYTNQEFINALSHHIIIYRKANIEEYKDEEFVITPALVAIYNSIK